MNGVWEMAAATRSSRTAAATTWPPENEVPHRTIRSGSTPSSVRAQAMAACQSSCWRAIESSWRGVPSEAPKWR